MQPIDMIVAYNSDLARQRGAGIGSIFSSLYNTVVPLVKSALGFGSRVARSQVGRQVAKSVKKRAMKAGLNVVNDALQGENVLDSTRREVKRAGGKVLSDLTSGVMRPQKRKANFSILRAPSRRRKLTRPRKDIFSV